MTARRAKPSSLRLLAIDEKIRLYRHQVEACKLLRRYRFLLLDDYGNAPLQVHRWLRRDERLNPKRKVKGGKRG